MSGNPGFTVASIVNSTPRTRVVFNHYSPTLVRTSSLSLLKAESEQSLKRYPVCSHNELTFSNFREAHISKCHCDALHDSSCLTTEGSCSRGQSGVSLILQNLVAFCGKIINAV